MSFAGYAPTTGQPVDADTIRVGVIGTGFGASLHLSALRECPGFTTVAIASRRVDRAAVGGRSPHVTGMACWSGGRIAATGWPRRREWSAVHEQGRHAVGPCTCDNPESGHRHRESTVAYACWVE